MSTYILIRKATEDDTIEVFEMVKSILKSETWSIFTNALLKEVFII